MLLPTTMAGSPTDTFAGVTVLDDSLGFWVPVVFWLIVIITAMTRGYLLVSSVAVAGFISMHITNAGWTQLVSLLFLTIAIAVEWIARRFALRRHGT
jgi:membrane protein implicated in regulation of membrane protease activity